MKTLQLKLKQSVELSQIARLLHQLVIDGVSFRFTRRVDHQMESLGLERTDIRTIVKKCRVTQILGGSVAESFHYRVEANTLDEKGVELVVRIEKQPPSLEEQLAIVNVRWVEAGRERHEEMQKVQVEFKKRSVSKIRR